MTHQISPHSLHVQGGPITHRHARALLSSDDNIEIDRGAGSSYQACLPRFGGLYRSKRNVTNQSRSRALGHPMAPVTVAVGEVRVFDYLSTS
jgi:hypothetical protein